MMQMQRMRMQQHQGMMRAGEPMPNMMSNGSGMEMMGPNGMMMRQGMGPGPPGMPHGPMGSRPPPPEYGMSQQGGQNMPYMMGPGSNMRLPGPQRNAGMQQIPPSGPMMRAQNSLGDKIKMPQSMGNNMNMPGPMNPMMMGGMNMNPGMKQGPMNNMNMMN